MEEETVISQVVVTGQAQTPHHVVDVNVGGTGLEGLSMWWEGQTIWCCHHGAPEMVLVVQLDQMDPASVAWVMQNADEEEA